MKFNYKIWCKLFNVLSVWWYIKFYDVFFSFLLLFYCCTIKRNPFVQRQIHFLNEETWNELDTRWPRDKIPDGGGYCTIFSLPSLSTFVQKSHKIYDKIELFQSLKENPSWKSFLSSKYPWKHNRFSIVIMSICETRNEWLIRSYRLMSLDWSDV